MMKHDSTLTLQEISDQTQVEIRTLRSWIDEGLLDPPDKSGRGARYPRENVERAFAVLALKKEKKSLKEIAEMFMLASPVEIQDWAAQAPSLTTSPAPTGSPREYLENLRASEKGVMRAHLAPEHQMDDLLGGSSTDQTPLQRRNRFIGTRPEKPRSRPNERRMEEIASIETLIPELERILMAPKPPRRVRSETWTRLPVTFDFELSVRGELTPRERHIFEQFAGELRALLKRKDPT